MAEEFDCNAKPGIGVLMEVFEVALLAMIEPYLKPFELAVGLPTSIIPDNINPADLLTILAKVAPPVTLALAAAKIPKIMKDLPVMNLPPPFGKIGGLDMSLPPLPSLTVPGVPAVPNLPIPDIPPLPNIVLPGIALAGLLKGLLIDMLPPMLAKVAGVKLNGLKVEGLVAPEFPNFDKDIPEILANVPGLDTKAADQCFL